MFSWRRNIGNAPPMDQKPAFSLLLNCAKKGEAEATSTLYRTFLPGVFSYIAARVPDRITAEDLTSDVFLKMVEGLHQVRAHDEPGFAAWLYQIARITVAGYYRGKEKQPLLIPIGQTSPVTRDNTDTEEDVPDYHPDIDPVYRAEINDEWATVVAAINTLTEEQRQVLINRLILGYDIETVAQLIGKKANAVKALQFRALNSLQRLLKKNSQSTEERTLITYNKRRQEDELSS
jgi:RNA polymerase sigma-70 factor (ECF subfamily)